MSNDSAACIFNRAIEMEYGAQQLYLRFAELFRHFDEISVFWKDLANDEVIHAEKLYSIRSNLSQETLASPVSPSLYHAYLKSQVLDIGHIMSRINNLDDAYEMAHDIEFSEVNVIFKLLASDYGLADQRKDFIASEIRKHQNKLIEFGRKFGDKLFRSSIEVINDARTGNRSLDKKMPRMGTTKVSG